MQRTDRIGKQFGRLTVISYSGNQKWLCQCICGVMVTPFGASLNNGHTKSCGCLKQELTSIRSKRVNTTHAHSRSNFGRPTLTYKSWLSMKQRCLNSKKDNFHLYGGRGIMICPEWIDSFDTFLQDIGERSPGTTLNRINRNGNYEPGNCEWADKKRQESSECKAILRGYSNPQSKLTENTVKAIRFLYSTKEWKLKELAKQYDVSIAAVSKVINNQTWIL